MKEIKSIHEIKNGWLVVTRDEQRYIKIDDILVGKSDGYYLDVEKYGTGLKHIRRFEDSEDFDIIEIWEPKYKAATLSFDLEDRELVWEEQEQKYYIAHRWIDTEKYNYVNLIKSTNEMILDTIRKNKNFQTEFTASEIEELKEKYNTTLEDFEIIPVEEI